MKAQAFTWLAFTSHSLAFLRDEFTLANDIIIDRVIFSSKWMTRYIHYTVSRAARLAYRRFMCLFSAVHTFQILLRNGYTVIHLLTVDFRLDK